MTFMAEAVPCFGHADLFLDVYFEGARVGNRIYIHSSIWGRSVNFHELMEFEWESYIPNDILELGRTENHAHSYMAAEIEPMSLSLEHVTVETVTRFAFDNRNNRTTRIVTGAETYTVTYTYDLNNRLLTKVRTGDEPSTTTFTYDNNGNQLTQTTDGDTKTLTYDVFNHLVRVERQGMVAVYAYRADGLRQSKTVNGHTTTHVWDRGSIILELNGSGAVMNRFSRGVGHLIRSSHHGFYLFNARTDVVQRVDSNGDILHTYRYDAFGNQQNQDQVNTNPFRFAAEYYDFETGFIYLRARFYNPLTGRMLSEDPHWNIRNMQFGDIQLMRHGRMLPSHLAIIQAANLFVFALNNPVRFIDPSGLRVVDALRDFGSGVVDGFVGHYQALVHVVTNPVDTVVGIVDAFIEDPLGMYLQTTILNPINPITGPLVIAHEITNAGSAYETGFVVGGYLGQACTAAVGYGVSKAVGYVVATKLVPIGTNFGRLGTVVANDGTRVINWSNTTIHGTQRMAERGVTQSMANSWVRTGSALQQSSGNTLFVTREGAVVLNASNQVVTAYTSASFDAAMTSVVRQLFGR